MFEIAKRGFTFFVARFPSYELVYGAFAAVPMFLLWIYISWTLVLFGAEVSRALTIYHAQRRGRREPHFYTLLAVLEQLWQAQQRGEPLADSCILQRVAALDQGRWDQYVELLIRGGLVRRTEQGHYMLSRDLSSYTLAQLQAMLPWPLPEGLPATEPGWRQEVSARLDILHQKRVETLDLPLKQLFASGGQQAHQEA